MSKNILVTGRVSDAKMFINNFRVRDFKVMVVSPDPVPDAVATKAYVCDYDIAQQGSGHLVGGDLRYTFMGPADTLIHIVDTDLESSKQSNSLVNFIEEVYSKRMLSNKLKVLVLSQEVDAVKNFKQSSEGRSIANNCRDNLKDIVDKVISVVYERDQSRWCVDALNYILDGKDSTEEVDFILSSGALFRNNPFVPAHVKSFEETTPDIKRSSIKTIAGSNLFGSGPLATNLYPYSESSNADLKPTAVVTGDLSINGAAVVAHLTKEGYSVIVSSRDNEVYREINDLDTSLEFERFDHNLIFPEDKVLLNTKIDDFEEQRGKPLVINLFVHLMGNDNYLDKKVIPVFRQGLHHMSQYFAKANALFINVYPVDILTKPNYAEQDTGVELAKQLKSDLMSYNIFVKSLSYESRDYNRLSLASAVSALSKNQGIIINSSLVRDLVFARYGGGLGYCTFDTRVDYITGI